MNLKGIMQTLGAKPGQVVSNPYARAFTPQVETIVKEEEDHEVSMANNSLDTIIKMATELKAKMGENEKDIPAWIQDHITNAENFISQASSNYHEYGTNEAGINGADRFPTLNAESVNEVSRRATDFYGDSKYGKSIDLLLKGKWDSKKVENFLEKLGGGNDVKYARIIDFISGDAGLNIRKYKNIGEQLPELMKQLEVLYKDFLTESVNKSLRLTKIK